MSSRTLLTSIVMIVSFLTMLVKVASRATLAVTTLAAQQNRRDVNESVEVGSDGLRRRAVLPRAGFSLAEMKAIAVEAGLDPVLIERAARLMPVGSSKSRLERVAGGPLKHRLDAHTWTL